MDSLGYVDLFFLTIMIFMAVRGFFSGFICELFGLIGVIVGVAVASRYAYEAGDWFRQKVFYFESQTLAALLGFILILLVIWVVMLCLSALVFRLTKAALPRYLNGLLGALFGGIKTFLVFAILLHFLFRPEFMSGVMKHISEHSVLYPTMEALGSKIVKIDVTQNLPKSTEEVQESIEGLKGKAVNGLKSLNNLTQQKAQKGQESTLQGQ